MIFPQWTTNTMIMYAFLGSITLMIGPLEYYGQSMMAYSKFRPASGIPTRVGMFILYLTPLLALVLSAIPYLPAATAIQWTVFGAVFIHFAKRVLEVLFLHKYSGPIGLFTTLLITGFYSFAAFWIGTLNRTPLPTVDVWFYFGIILFIIGILGNFIHHKILADLRTGTNKYIIPKGGLFDLIACPHYLFEIIIWLGIALLSRHLGTFLIFGFIIAYLTARSLRTLKWYRDKFSNFPAGRKAILPFIL